MHEMCMSVSMPCSDLGATSHQTLAEYCVALAVQREFCWTHHDSFRTPEGVLIATGTIHCYSGGSHPPSLAACTVVS